ncbi:hypothetical protein SB18R_03245 [Pseudomonas oryzihabitans]|nr:hypothetical protein SB9_12480 [Pseudomonas psychrotolerans]KTT78259.1 hypothetical protein SB18R_03245 [Pseudomonas psychrotolerans]
MTAIESDIPSPRIHPGGPMAQDDLNAGDVQLAKQKSQQDGRAQRLANQIQSQGQPLSGAMAPAMGNPERAARMQAQFDTPVTRGIPAPAASVAPVTNYGPNLGQIQAGALADIGRSLVAQIAGGDPATLPGGQNSFTNTAMSQATRKGTGSLGDDVLTHIGARRADGSDPQQDPATAQTPVPAPVPSTSPATPSVPTQEQALIAPPAATAAPATPATNGYRDTGIADGLGSKIVMRRDAQGRPSFTNDPAAVAGAQSSAVNAQPRAGLSIIGGGQEGMERNLRAVQIMQQARAENAGSGLTIVPDSTQGTLRQQQQRAQMQAQAQEAQQRGGLQQQIPAYDPNRAAADRLAVQRGQQELAGGQLQLQQAQRLADLQAVVADNKRPAAERQQAAIAIQALQGNDKDRYQAVEVPGGVDQSTGKTIVLRKMFDTRTGHFVDEVNAASGVQAAPSERKFTPGSIYRNPSGQSARFKGYDSNGKEQWEPV